MGSSARISASERRYDTLLREAEAYVPEPTIVVDSLDYRASLQELVAPTAEEDLGGHEVPATERIDMPDNTEVIDADLIGWGEDAEENAAKKQKSGEVTPERGRAIRSFPLDQQGLGRLVMSLSDRLDNMLGSMGSKVTELNREVIKIRKQTDRRHEAQVERKMSYEKIIDEATQHDINQDARLNDFKAEVKQLEDQASSGVRA